MAFKIGGVTSFINPKKTMDSASLYLKNGFEKSRIKIDEQSTKVLQLKMVDFQRAKNKGSFGGYAKMELIIPEKNFSRFYEASEYTAWTIGVGLVYAIHSITRQIIDDPVIQDYILCR